MSLFMQNLDDHIAVCGRVSALNEAIEAVGKAMAKSIADGNKLMFCGNGGSAADSQHLASELTGRFINDRRPLAAIALTVDSSALTCIGNDYSFADVFSRQVEGLGRAGDCLFGISTSGNSENVLRAFNVARRLNITTIGLLGRDGGKMRAASDLAIVVPSDVTARIQEMHILIGHTICGLIEHELGIAG